MIFSSKYFVSLTIKDNFDSFVKTKYYTKDTNYIYYTKEYKCTK